MYFGADYYPEHWPEERWPIDAKLMREAGMNLVRVAEFSWAKLEPSEGVYDFSWLDRALDVLYKEGIKVVMCTPTATPPKWLMDKHPDIYQVDENGLVQGFGSRRHYCYNNETYREYSAKITEKMALHYKDHPAIAAWQIDNEFTCGDGLYCYCEHCRQKFIAWLKKKYKSLDALNKAWGTVFWSQTYTDWNQIIVPRKAQASTPTNNGHNPGLNLDYSRFMSDSVVEYAAIQTDILHQYYDVPITHNIVSELFDYYKLGKHLDICCFDNYPANSWLKKIGEENYGPALSTDIMRGIKNKNFWVMEEQSGPCGWEVVGRALRPGEIKLWTYQTMAHGAEAVVYFRWRTCLFGTEQYWHGILDHDGKPRRRYNEIKEIGSTFPKVSKYNINSKVAADIFMIRDFEQQWSHEFQKHSWEFNYRNYLKGLYAGLYKNNYNLDVSSVETDFSKYKLVLAPAFNLMSDELKKKFEEYVRNGGNLVVTFRSGTRHMDNRMTEETLPGYFRELAGIEVEEYDSICNFKVKVSGQFGNGEASIWADIINPVTAKPLAVYDSEYYKGKAAITVNSYGKGKCYYIGCDLDADATYALMDYIAKEAGVEKALDNVPENVEVVKKYTEDGKEFYFIMNFNNFESSVELPFDAINIETDEKLGNKIVLSAYGSIVVTKQ